MVICLLFSSALKGSEGVAVRLTDNLPGRSGGAGGYYPDYSAIDQGVTGDGNTLIACVGRIGTRAVGTIYFLHNSGDEWTDYNISTDVDLSSYDNIFLYFEPGARLAAAEGVTVKLSGPSRIDAIYNQQIKSGPGALIFAHEGNASPIWFGAVGDGSTDDAGPLQECLNSGANSIYIPSGSYKYTTSLSVPRSVRLMYGDGPGNSVLRPSGCIGLDFAQDTGFVEELKIFRDFEIRGYNDKDQDTGIGVRFKGTNDASDTYQGVRFNNLRIRGLNTGFYLRTVRDIEISGCKIWAYYGIINKGQVVVGRYHNNDIIYSALGSAKSYGVQISSATDYSGAREKRPEDIQIYQNRLYGYDIAVYEQNCLLLQIMDNDLDNIKQQGIYLHTVDGNFIIERNYISLNHADASDGIYLAYKANHQNRTCNIRGNHITATTKLKSADGIEVRGGNGEVTIDGNSIEKMTGYDIYIHDEGRINIINNNCYSSLDCSLYIVSRNGGVIKVDGNYFAGYVYFHPSASLGTLDMGFNSGKYSTRILGRSEMPRNRTKVTTAYADMIPTPPDLAPSASTNLYPRLIIYSPEVNLGNIWGEAGQSEVTINCESRSHAKSEINWEVVLFPDIK